MKQAPGSVYALPARLQRIGRTLLHRQCWLWGQDIKRSEGNLLLDYGFERLRAPVGISGSTQYTLALNDGLRVRLWGFGMYFGEDEGIYLNRFEFTPRAARLTAAWQDADAMSALPRSHRIDLLAQTAYWIATYESWVTASVGLAWRRRALHSWKDSSAHPAKIASEWSNLAAELFAFETQQTQRHSAQVPYTKNSWLVATNPRGSFGLTCISHPSSSKSLPHPLHWK